MWRTIGGIIAGLVAWAVIVTLIDIGLRLTIPHYAQVEPQLVFTLPMKIARLAMAAITSLLTGTLIRAAAPQSRLAPWIVGLIILAMFVPEHIHLWNRFPIWYHLTFLVPLAPLLALGAELLPRTRAAAA